MKLVINIGLCILSSRIGRAEFLFVDGKLWESGSDCVHKAACAAVHGFTLRAVQADDLAVDLIQTLEVLDCLFSSLCAENIVVTANTGAEIKAVNHRVICDNGDASFAKCLIVSHDSRQANDDAGIILDGDDLRNLFGEIHKIACIQNIKLNPGLFSSLLCACADVNEIVKVRTEKNKRNLLAAQISRSGRIGTGFSRGRCGGRRWSHLFCLGRGGAASQTAERECRNQGNRKNMNKAFFIFLPPGF